MRGYIVCNTCGARHSYARRGLRPVLLGGLIVLTGCLVYVLNQLKQVNHEAHALRTKEARSAPASLHYHLQGRRTPDATESTPVDNPGAHVGGRLLWLNPVRHRRRRDARRDQAIVSGSGVNTARE